MTSERADAERRVAEIEAREKAATAGEWHQDCLPHGPCAAKCYREAVLVDNYSNDAVVNHVRIAERPKYDCGKEGQTFRDMVFIAGARADVPWLIAELRAAWAREDSVRPHAEALASYRRGLAAARAALKKWHKTEFQRRYLRSSEQWLKGAEASIAVIDALLAGAEGKCIKMFNKKLETQGQ